MSIVRNVMPVIVAAAMFIAPAMAFAKSLRTPRLLEAVPAKPNRSGPRGSSLPESMSGAFQEGYKNALSRLQGNSDCRNFFGPGADQKFSGANFRSAPMGAAHLDANGDPTVTGAVTFAEDSLIMINSQGNFMNQNVFVPGRSAVAHLDGHTGLVGADFSAVVLLHELGHLVGKFDPDSQDQALNDKQTRAVVDHCFKDDEQTSA